ncbi:uncharacterized protein LOC130290689 [Hyla sarda]|uniref:uncharacterized protein LOC130290689 n=1 Tax=Hyla sarda TaxID=327740 RepID=UPI0024C39AD5|nr:uncharacterized protein LOC130290689 [Hyla sarda]
MDVCKEKKAAAASMCKECDVEQSASHGVQSDGNMTEFKTESIVGTPKSANRGHGGAQELGQSGSQAAGVQLHSPAQRQRRTSLERQTLQENLQQQEVVSSMTRSGRTRSQAGGKSHNTDKSMEVTPGKSVEKYESVCKTVPAPDPNVCDRASGDTSSQGSSVFTQPERLSRPLQQGKETARAPELQLAEEIPALVRRMEELKHQKQMLQMQIDCIYKLRTANPQYKSMHDDKLYALSTELATIVSEMDSILERMGPLAESYRNKERFSQYQLSFGAEPRSDVEADITPDEPQQVTRPLIKPPSFTFKDRHVHKPEEQQPQRPAAVLESATHLPAEALQVPEVPVHQEDSGHLPVYEGDGVMEQSSNVGARTGGEDCDDVGAQTGGADCDVLEGSVAGGGAQSVWGVVSDNDIEVDGTGDVVHNTVQDFPPLPTSTAAVAGPPRVDPDPVRQDAGTRQVPPRNAWSRGAPSFTSSPNYTGQAFKRRNVVRFRHRGAKEDLPDRRFVVRELLCHQMGFVPADILAVINLPDRQGYDVSFKLMSNLDRFWSNFPRFRDAEGWSKFSFIPISKPDTVIINIIFWNEAVPPQDIVVWLRRHCDLVSDLTKNRDDDGIWTGGWKVLVKLRQHGNITQHLPNSFFIGREKGVCFYPGQPRKCFKCGKPGHLANTCTVVKCNLCGETGHVSADCHNIRCNLCGEIGHPHRDCPNAWHNICRELPDEDLVAGAEAVEEEALLSDPILTRQEVQTDVSNTAPTPQQSESTQGDMEVVPQDQQQPGVSTSVSEGNRMQQNKRRKKDKSSRRPEGENSIVQSVKKRADNRAGVMVVSNRYEVLSESEGDLDTELKRIEDDCDVDTRDQPPIKKKPPSVKPQVESDMETGGGQRDSDSDL